MDFGFELTLFLRLVLAVLFGVLIGHEREQRGKPAGARTQALVAFGACLFTILSIYAFPGSDTARVAAQIVSGIGFLGAGLIIFREKEQHVEGVTTAATLWAVVALGMAIGAGLYVISILGAVLVYFILSTLPRFLNVS